jgi:hypothetical protein
LWTKGILAYLPFLPVWIRGAEDFPHSTKPLSFLTHFRWAFSVPPLQAQEQIKGSVYIVKEWAYLKQGDKRRKKKGIIDFDQQNLGLPQKSTPSDRIQKGKKGNNQQQ